MRGGDPGPDPITSPESGETLGPNHAPNTQHSVMVALAAAGNPLGLLEGAAVNDRVGSIGVGPEFNIRSRTQVRVHFVMAVLFSCGLPIAVGVFGSWLSATLAAIVIALYSLSAYWISPNPNWEHTHIVGNPFRLSDNINSSLRGLGALLAPGKLIAHGYVDGIRLLRTGKLPHEGFLEGLEDATPRETQPPEL